MVHGADEVQRDARGFAPLHKRQRVEPVQQRQQPRRLLGVPRPGIVGEAGRMGEDWQ
ncbi:MAG TPA: hypothetical protein VFS94_08845 [Gemmatimonadales bacterium]|nr:hypothetical protein [Gemmatimonadales bacterium]